MKKTFKKPLFSGPSKGVMAVVAAGLIGYGAASLETAGIAAPIDTESVAPDLAPAAAMSFAPLVERVSPAVVSIQVRQSTPRADAGRPPQGFALPPGHPFERFFEEFGAPDGEAPQRRAPRAVSQGSGFVISADGFVVTNNHVVEGAEEIEVAFTDGRTLDAELVGTDPKTDLALLKVSADAPFQYVAFGDDEALKVGDWVVAVGNPFGLGGTVTAGIVSARGREIGAGPYDDFIQIDASINRGNSGGPTFDIEGNVVGVNTAIFSPSGGSVGIGFAIPASLARDVIAELKADGVVTRGWLGVAIQPLNDDLAAGFDLSEDEGALVAEVTPGSPAEEAGVEPGDVIVAVDERPIESVRDLTRLIAGLEPGDDIDLGIWRDGREREIDVEIGKFPEETTLAAGPSPEWEGTSASALGLELSRSAEGVRVADVDPASEAAAKGIRPGDVILKVGGHTVETPEEVAERLSAAEGNEKTILLLVRSAEQQRFVALSLESA